MGTFSRRTRAWHAGVNLGDVMWARRDIIAQSAKQSTTPVPRFRRPAACVQHEWLQFRSRHNTVACVHKHDSCALQGMLSMAGRPAAAPCQVRGNGILAAHVKQDVSPGTCVYLGLSACIVDSDWRVVPSNRSRCLERSASGAVNLRCLRLTPLRPTGRTLWPSR